MEKKVNSCNNRILILLSKEKSANPIKAGKEKNEDKNEISKKNSPINFFSLSVQNFP
jgi:hypothetical protein